MQLLRPSLLDGHVGYYIFALLALLFSYALLIEYHQYTKLVAFDDVERNATVLQIYQKEKDNKPYLLLKTRLDNGVILYTATKQKYQNILHQKVRLQIWAKATFLEYLRGFYSYSKIREVYSVNSLKSHLLDTINKQHKSSQMQEIYGALFLAQGMSAELQTKLSALGISHLLAISGFHLGVLSMLVVGLLYFPYQLLQSRYFPFRSRHRDLFILSGLTLLAYLLFLGLIPSLLRAFVMLLIGYLFFDRGLKVLSMQTLLFTVLMILALFPKLFFSMGLWLSVMGVYFIFLYFTYFSSLNKIVQFVLLPTWVYLMMLPVSLYIFQTFSLLHPLSILWTLLFTLFYPLSGIMHFFGYGNYLDTPIIGLLNSVSIEKLTFVHTSIFALFSVSALAAMRCKSALIVSTFIALCIFIGAIYQVT